MERLHKCDAKLGPARLLRFIQLHVRAWILGFWDTNDHTEARRIPLPPLRNLRQSMLVDDMSWLPDMPHNRPKHTLTTAVHPQIRSNETKRPKITVLNPHWNKIFEDLQTNMANTRFNAVITKVGAPPPVTREGANVLMCASYHLRGSCFTTCTPANGHAPHSAEEYQKLYTWCTKAFA
jgi:hypothetical protein